MQLMYEGLNGTIFRSDNFPTLNEVSIEEFLPISQFLRDMDVTAREIYLYHIFSPMDLETIHSKEKKYMS